MNPRLSVLLLGVAVAACGSSTEAPIVASVSVTPDSTGMKVGDVVTFSATALDATGATITGKPIYWSVNDQTVVSITSDGEATALMPGYVVVRASIDGVYGRAGVLVEPGPPASIIVTPDSTVLDPGATRTFESIVTDARGNKLSGVPVTWTSTNTTVAPVAAPGTLEGLTAGTTLMIGSVSASVADTASARVVALTYKDVSAAGQYTCAASLGLAVYCWGTASNGVLGNGVSSGTQPTPTAVLSGVELLSVSGSGTHTCAVERGGGIYCWGRNNRGQVGDGTTATRLVPSFAQAEVQFVAATAGGIHSCGLTADGDSYCWGGNDQGEIGQAPDPEPGLGVPPTVHPLPVPVQAAPTFASITAGNLHTCALTPAGAAYCWGDGRNGALGINQQTRSGAPLAVLGGLTFVSLSAGQDYTCGVAQGGDAYCWGRGVAQQLGTGDTLDLVPTLVQGGLQFASIATGSTHTCALTLTGAAYCWGNGTYGQLGTGVTGISSGTPLAVTGGLSFTAISVSAGGGGHTCALTAEPALYCWGRNNASQIGDGTTVDQPAPTRVTGQ